MDLPTAIDEFVEMLTLGGEALRSFARSTGEPKALARLDASLTDIRTVARRLSAIAENVRDEQKKSP